jgi:hypothetical protein
MRCLLKIQVYEILAKAGLNKRIWDRAQQDNISSFHKLMNRPDDPKPNHTNGSDADAAKPTD